MRSGFHEHKVSQWKRDSLYAIVQSIASPCVCVLIVSGSIAKAIKSTEHLNDSKRCCMRKIYHFIINHVSYVHISHLQDIFPKTIKRKISNESSSARNMIYILMKWIKGVKAVGFAWNGIELSWVRSEAKAKAKAKWINVMALNIHLENAINFLMRMKCGSVKLWFQRKHHISW